MSETALFKFSFEKEWKESSIPQIIKDEENKSIEDFLKICNKFSFNQVSISKTLIIENLEFKTKSIKTKVNSVLINDLYLSLTIKSFTNNLYSSIFALS